MTDHDEFDSQPLELPDEIVQLLQAATQWTAQRWSEAILTARGPLHRGRRAISRPLCEALLAHEQRALSDWLVRDAVRTAVASAVPRLAASESAIATELLEDAALAMLARPALPMLDLAVLAGPCWPLRADVPSGGR